MKFRIKPAIGGLVAGLLLGGCGSSGVDIGPTIADLENLPPQLETVELEPSVEFTVDRQQVIDSLRELVAITAEGGGSGDELRRLADLELEASLDNRMAEDETLQQLGQQEALSAIGIYEGYLEKYPDREDNDLVLYQLSRAYALEQDTDRSMAALDRIVTEYPESRYLAETQFRRGEILFVLDEYELAEQAYGTIVNDFPGSLYFDKALYKYGWSQFKLGRFDDAVASYIRLLDLNLRAGNIGEMDYNPFISKADRQLLEDVVRVIALCFSYNEDNLYIARYFDKTGKRDYEPMLYAELGLQYLEKDRVFDATGIFLGYTGEYPYSPHAPVFHQRAIIAYDEAGYGDLVLQEKINFVNRYDIGTEYWEVQNEQNRKALRPTLARHTTDLATHYHALARESRALPDHLLAASWYRRFLASFPDDPTAPRMRFLLAENLYDARDYRQALPEYEAVAYDYESHADSAEAGYAALLTYDALVKTSEGEQRTALEQQRFQSAVAFTTRFPNDSRLPAVELQSAQQFFEWQQYPAAIASATRLINNPIVDEDKRQVARAILADAQFSSGNYAEAEAAYLALMASQSENDPERQAVREQVAASIYRQGEQARDAGELRLAAEQFNRLGEVIPESPKRMVAEYDAASAYVQLEDWPATIDQLQKFRTRYPANNRFNDGVTEKLALAYSETGDSSNAAKEMLALSVLTVTPERKRDLMWRAAELYEEDGQTDKAIRVYKDYVEAYPYPLARSMELRFKISEYYRAGNDTKNLRYWLNETVIADARGGEQRSDRSRYLAATASLELTEPLRQAYRRAKLTVPLKASLREKKKLMQQSIDAYNKAMQYQVQQVTTEATYQVAEIYHEFARALMESERPRELNEEQLEEYDLLLEEQAFPFEEKAIEIHLANFRRIPAGTYDTATRESLRVLGELMPFRYARAESSDTHVEIQ